MFREHEVRVNKSEKRRAIAKWKFHFDFPGEPTPERLKDPNLVNNCILCTKLSFRDEDGMLCLDCDRCTIYRISGTGCGDGSIHQNWALAENREKQKMHAGELLNIMKKIKLEEE